MEVLQAELNKTVGGATSSYSEIRHFLQCIYSVPQAKNH